MAKISFTKGSREPLEVEKSTPLMKALLDAKIPVASSCLGKGVCSKCRLQVVAGAENLSLETTFEKILRTRNKIPDGWRISCQALVNGDVTVDAPYW